MPVYESIKNADNKIKISAANRDSAVFGWDKAISFLADKVKAGAKAIAIDGWYGIDYEKIAVALKDKIGDAVLLPATDLYVSREEIVGQKRNKEIMAARHVTIFLMREITELSTGRIGDILGGRDHSTVMSSCKTVRTRMVREPLFASDIENLKAEITGN